MIFKIMVLNNKNARYTWRTKGRLAAKVLDSLINFQIFYSCISSGAKSTSGMIFFSLCLGFDTHSNLRTKDRNKLILVLKNLYFQNEDLIIFLGF